MHVVVIGAVALGPKAACRFKRLMPEATVTMIDQSDRISYGGCGLPYYVSGEVSNIKELQETTYKVVRDAHFFKEAKGVDVKILTRATKIDRKNKTVSIENVQTGAKEELGYDKLVIATGTTPNKPPVAGLNLQGVTHCTNLDEGEYIHNALSTSKVNSAVIIGAGFIGLELAVALADMWGIDVSIVEFAPQAMPNSVSKKLSSMIEHDLNEKGVKLYTGEKVVELKGANNKVTHAVTDKRTLEADLVIVAAGVTPATKLFQDAGIITDNRGGIIVNEQMQTNDPNIYAGGDCVVVPNLITGKRGFFPLGGIANRQGRVIGTNLAGGNARFPGAVGSWGVKLFDISAAGAGLTIDAALAEGFNAVSVHVEAADRAHFYPEGSMMTLEMVVDKATRRVLGIQGASAMGDALTSRINMVAAILGNKPLIDDISNLEIVYTPPFAAAMDIINVVANVADNLLAGRLHGMETLDFVEQWNHRADNGVFFIDTRLASGAQELLDKYPDHWHSIPTEEIEARLGEIPKDRPVVLICNSGLRSFEALLHLNKHGYTNASSVMGGMTGVRKTHGDL